MKKQWELWDWLYSSKNKSNKTNEQLVEIDF